MKQLFTLSIVFFILIGCASAAAADLNIYPCEIWVIDYEGNVLVTTEAVYYKDLISGDFPF